MTIESLQTTPIINVTGFSLGVGLGSFHGLGFGLGSCGQGCLGGCGYGNTKFTDRPLPEAQNQHFYAYLTRGDNPENSYISAARYEGGW